MNRTVARGRLNGAGISLPIWALILSFFVSWWWIPAAIGFVLLIVAGALDWCAADVGYAETVHGGER